MVTLTTEVVQMMKMDHDLVILANERSKKNEESLKTNWKWTIRIAAVSLFALAVVAPDKILKVLL